jgi:hypothetical protein
LLCSSCSAQVALLKSLCSSRSAQVALLKSLCSSHSSQVALLKSLCSIRTAPQVALLLKSLCSSSRSAPQVALLLKLLCSSSRSALLKSLCSSRSAQVALLKSLCSSCSAQVALLKSLCSSRFNFNFNQIIFILVGPFPNLGPKVNHHFRMNNSAYMEIEHPRWGLIQSVTATTDIKAGQEVFTNYGYNRPGPFPLDFPWYFDAKTDLERLEAEEKQQ